MVKKLLFSSAVLATAFFFFSLETTTVSAYSNQAPPQAVTGAPGHGTCANSGCHTGGTFDTTSNSNLSHNIPNDAYVPGTTYSIDVSISGLNSAKNGFEITAMDANNNIVGEFLANANISILSSGDYASHTPNSTGLSNWTIDWVAPAAGIGDITFYAAVNVSNANNNTLGDEIRLNSFTVSEFGAPPVSINEINPALSVQVFPQPTQKGEVLNIKFSKSGTLNATLTDVQGKQVLSLRGEQVNEHSPYELSTLNLSRGIYALSGSVNDFAFTQKIVIH